MVEVSNTALSRTQRKQPAKKRTMTTTTETLTYEQILTLAKFAKSDMRIARREGCMSIVDTKVGCIDLSYDKATRSYTMVSRGCAQRIAFTGLAAGGVESRLVGLYNVVFE
jgi:hypothetical protein